MTHALIDKPARALRRWWRTRAAVAELRRLPDSERARMLNETGLTEYDIDHLVADHPGPGTLLPARLAEAGIDAGYLAASEPDTLRDMQRVCSRCQDWKQCEADFERSGATGLHDAYCPNTPTIDGLVVAKSRGPGAGEAGHA